MKNAQSSLFTSHCTYDALLGSQSPNCIASITNIATLSIKNETTLDVVQSKLSFVKGTLFS